MGTMQTEPPNLPTHFSLYTFIFFPYHLSLPKLHRVPIFLNATTQCISPPPLMPTYPFFVFCLIPTCLRFHVCTHFQALILSSFMLMPTILHSSHAYPLHPTTFPLSTPHALHAYQLLTNLHYLPTFLSLSFPLLIIHPLITQTRPYIEEKQRLCLQGCGLKLEPNPYVKIKSSKLIFSPILNWPSWRCGLKLEPSPYVKIKSSKLFCSPILSWPSWRCGLKLEPRPVCVDERPFALLSHFKLAHVHSKPMLTSSYFALSF